MDLRRIIKAEVEKQGLTQDRLGELTGLLQHRLSEYLSGKRDMTGENLQKILGALGLELRSTRSRRKER
jgi:transcriptional regulator with XRE-family HTH domain